MSIDNVDTYLWDTAFGITFEEANSAISNAGSSPASFSETYTDQLADRIAVSATFGTWQLVGGAGPLVHLQLPLTSGKLTQKSHDFTFSGSATIEIRLNYLPQPGHADTLQLKPKLTTENPTLEPVVSVTEVDLTDGEGLSDHISAALEEWLLANLAEFDHVFAVVNLKAQATPPALQWLQPTAVSYAVEAEGSRGVLGVLAMTEGRPPIERSNEISPYIAPAAANAGCLIRPTLLMDKLLLPGVSQLFSNANAGDFQVYGDGLMLRNTKRLSFQHFKIDKHDGPVTGATIDQGKFTLEVKDNWIRMNITGMSFTWKEGYVVNVDYMGSSNLTMDENHNLQMAGIESSAIDIEVAQTAEHKQKEALKDTAIAVATAVAGAVLGGTLSAIGEAVGGVTAKAIEAAKIAAMVGSIGEKVAYGFLGPSPDITLEKKYSEALQKDYRLSAAAAAEDLRSLTNDQYQSDFEGWFRRNWRKLLGQVVANTNDGDLSKVPEILDSYAVGEPRTRLDGFAEQAVAATKWSGSTSPTLIDAKLDGAFQLGLKLGR